MPIPNARFCKCGKLMMKSYTEDAATVNWTCTACGLKEQRSYPALRDDRDVYTADKKEKSE